MYSVSNAYKQAIKEAVQKFHVRGKIGNTSFNTSNILKGSLSIRRQCSNDDELQIGTVYIGELTATFINVDLNRYAYQGKTISLEQGLDIGNSYEYVPEGKYKIAEAEWSASGMAVKAYDNMAKLDKRVRDMQTIGNLKQIADMACDACGVELANQSFHDFPNGSKTFVIYPDNDIETYRDLLSWIAQTMCCFVIANREGKIEFKRYGTEPVDTLDEYHRFKGGKFADYVTKYTGVSVVNIKNQTTSYYGLPQDDGLTYNLGSNPFLQINANEAIQELLNALATIQFVPFDISGVTNPAYDLGDVLSLPGGLGDVSKLFCITKRVLRYNGELQLKGAGKNPELASAKSKLDKELAGLARSKNDDLIQYYSFTNSKRIPIADGESEKIIDIRFTSTKITNVIFQAEILLNVETTVNGIDYNDAVGTINYVLNGETVEYSPVEEWVDGKHILHLLYYLSVEGGVLNRLEVSLSMAGGSVVIKQAELKACIYGQNLVATDAWDGIITIEEEVSDFSLEELIFENVNDFVTVSTQVPLSVGLTDNAADFNLMELLFETVADRVTINTHADSQPVLTQVGEPVLTEDGITIYTEGE